MRIVKEADERKNEILDAAEELFHQQGFDATTISNIIEKVGVARGTVYYYFKSKEDVMDALIERTGVKLFNAAKKIADNKNIPVLERLLQTLKAMNARDDQALLQHMHSPQNALMHQKTQKIMMENIPPILMRIIEDGIKEKLFDTPYPYESLEMMLAHINTTFDDVYLSSLSSGEYLKKINAFLFNLERIFGAKPGSFDKMIELFQTEGDIPIAEKS